MVKISLEIKEILQVCKLMENYLQQCQVNQKNKFLWQSI